MQNTPTPSKRTKQTISQNLPLSASFSQQGLQIQQQKFIRNKQRLLELQEKLAQLKKERAQKIHQIDLLDSQLQEVKEHKQVLPLIQQLRQHYKKLKEQLGNRFYYQQDDIDVDEMSYEQLLELGDKIGKVSKGLTDAQFMKLQRIVCQDVEQCSICQENLVVGVECVKLKCGHMYDTECLKGWFQMEKVCPLCKSESI